MLDSVRLFVEERCMHGFHAMESVMMADLVALQSKRPERRQTPFIDFSEITVLIVSRINVYVMLG
jgi:hypothetical protein